MKLDLRSWIKSTLICWGGDALLQEEIGECADTLETLLILLP